MGVNAVILAGAKNNNQLKKINQKYECLIKIGNKTMVDYVINTLQQVEVIDKIIVVGPVELNTSNIDILIPSQDSLLDNIKLGLQMTNSSYSLVLTSDIPLITVNAIKSFLNKCEKQKSNFYYPIIPKVCMENIFSTGDRTYFTLKEGGFTGGNIFLVDVEAVLELENLLVRILDGRKKPWKLAQLLGFKFIIKFLTNTLSLATIEDRIHKLTDYKGKAIVLEYPEVGFDIDNLTHLSIVKKMYSTSELKIN